MDTKSMISVGFDGGYGGLKFYGPDGGMQILSQVAVNGGMHFDEMTGFLKQVERPMMIETNDGQFYVGKGSHRFGRRIENMSFDRFSGSPEMRVMVYAIITKYIQEYGNFNAPLSVMVALPLMMMVKEMKDNRLMIRKWMMGLHEWKVDGERYAVEIGRVRWDSQPVMALFDYVMDFNGEPIPGHERALHERIGVLNIGMKTLDKMVIDGRTINEALTSSDNLGVRRLLELVNNKMSIGERDVMLRDGDLKYKDKLPIWSSEVNGSIENSWRESVPGGGEVLESFAGVLTVGGGTLIIGNWLNLVAGGINKALPVDDPVMATARGARKLDLAKF